MALSKMPPRTPSDPDLFSLPAELLLAIARRLDVCSRLALGSTCGCARLLVVNAAVLEVQLSSRAAGLLYEASVKLQVRKSDKPLSRASHAMRVKGRVLPLYSALHPESEKFSLCGEVSLSDADGGVDVCGTARMRRSARDESRHLLPVGLAPDCSCLGLSDGVLSAAPLAAPPIAPPPLRELPRVSLKSSLLLLDLSRAQRVCSLAASGMARLRTVRLPPSAKAVCLEACSSLADLRPTDGCPDLLSLRLDGCRQLRGASFADASWFAASLAELDLSWCSRVEGRDVAALLRSAMSLRSLSLRGLRLGGLLEASEQSGALPRLSALDVGFSSSIGSEAVLAFAERRSELLRCNLRAAGTVSADVYNRVGQLMQERAAAAAAASTDVIENRRRPKHLAARVAEPFYYLKRARRGGDGAS